MEDSLSNIILFFRESRREQTTSVKKNENFKILKINDRVVKFLQKDIRPIWTYGWVLLNLNKTVNANCIKPVPEYRKKDGKLLN